MTSKRRLAVWGATGLVGNELIVLLDQKGSCFSEIRLFASEESQGELYKIGNDEVSVETLGSNSFEGIDIAICATPASVAATLIPEALKAGVTVIDCAGGGELSEGSILLCPEVNAQQLTREARHVVMPSPASSQLARVLKVINDFAGLKQVFVTSLHATSGAGKSALDELWNQTLAIFNQKAVEEEELEHQIAFNCIPQIDLFLEHGETREEARIISETRSLLGVPHLPIGVTSVRVPVLYGYAQAVHFACEKPITSEQCIELLGAHPDVQVYPHANDYPMPLNVVGTDEVHVGRIRADSAVANGMACWIVADNVRRGLALNALRSAELLAESFSH